MGTILKTKWAIYIPGTLSRSGHDEIVATADTKTAVETMKKFIYNDSRDYRIKKVNV